MGNDIYDCEPVARAVLDRCDAVLREARAGTSLLDVMFGRNGTEGRLHDPEWAQPAIYALECALTALWAGVGIRPAVAAGEGVGELAAAWAAGVFTLEDGLRLAATRGAAVARPKARVAAAMPTGDPSGPGQDPFAEMEATYAAIETSPPSLTLLSQSTGQPINTGESPDWDCWRDQLLAPKPLHRCNGKLAELDVSLVAEIGPHATPGPIELAAWPGAQEHTDPSFPESVARAYQAGLPVSFAGLFAGETRRRIPLPGYPFERARHWIETVG